jgi:hypothetical protein
MQALDDDIDRERIESDFHVVHDENYFNRLQHSANTHKYVIKEYNSAG